MWYEDAKLVAFYIFIYIIVYINKKKAKDPTLLNEKDNYIH